MASKTILDLPKEIVLLIADYLGPMNTANLKMTCTFFHTIFSDNFYWQHWSKIYLQGAFPPLTPTNPSYPWEHSICKFYTERDTWTNTTGRNRTITIDHIHCASVDAVQLTKDGSICISGSRDKTLALWDVKRVLGGSSTPKSLLTNAHRGWIWNIFEADNMIYSASWDSTVNIWDIRHNINFLGSINCQRTALCLMLTDCKLLAVGLFNGVVQLYDPRTYRMVESFNIHTKPIFEMVSCGNLIYSASQDRKIGIFDLRCLQTISYIPMVSEPEPPSPSLLPSPNHPHASLPLALSVCSQFLYVGDSWGKLHLYDSQTFELKSTFNVVPLGRKRQITGIKHNSGSITVSSSDHFVRVFSLTDPPTMLWQRTTNGDPISLDRKNGVIAIGKDTNSFDIFTPTGHPFLE